MRNKRKNDETLNMCIDCKHCNKCEFIHGFNKFEGLEFHETKDNNYKVDKCDRFVNDYIRLSQPLVAKIFGTSRATLLHVQKAMNNENFIKWLHYNFLKRGYEFRYTRYDDEDFPLQYNDMYIKE